MSDKLIQALAAAAPAATQGDWHADDGFISYSVTCVVNGWNREIARIDGPNATNDMRFVALVSPQNILRVLAERDADKALIAEQAKRINELEARIVAP